MYQLPKPVSVVYHFSQSNTIRPCSFHTRWLVSPTLILPTLARFTHAHFAHVGSFHPHSFHPRWLGSPTLISPTLSRFTHAHFTHVGSFHPRSFHPRWLVSPTLISPTRFLKSLFILRVSVRARARACVCVCVCVCVIFRTRCPVNNTAGKTTLTNILWWDLATRHVSRGEEMRKTKE